MQIRREGLAQTFSSALEADVSVAPDLTGDLEVTLGEGAASRLLLSHRVQL